MIAIWFSVVIAAAIVFLGFAADRLRGSDSQGLISASIVVIVFLSTIAMSWFLALSGEPTSQWLWRDVLGAI